MPCSPTSLPALSLTSLLHPPGPLPLPSRRDVIKKVIAYMTLGLDVSRLFPDMIMACNSTRSGPAGASTDLVIKKMV